MRGVRGRGTQVGGAVPGVRHVELAARGVVPGRGRHGGGGRRGLARARPPRIGPPATAMPISEVDVAAWQPTPTRIPELDRVLGGGLVPGSVTLIGGEPGIGKSTLLLQALAAMAGAAHRCLLVSAEESAQQVRMRAERLGALHPRLWLLSETELPAILTALDEVAPAVVVIDSIQTVFDPDLSSPPAPSPRCGSAPTAWCGWPRSATWPWSWWATSPRTAAWPGPGCSSTWSTPSCPSRASATTPSASCGPPSTGSGRATSWSNTMSRADVELAGRIAMGGASTPTPTGRFAVTDKILFRNARGPYGCCALALTGHQPRLPSGWKGGDRIAIHSTSRGKRGSASVAAFAPTRPTRAGWCAACCSAA